VARHRPLPAATRAATTIAAVATALAVTGLLAACGSDAPAPAAHSTTASSTWADQDVSFTAGGVTVYGTYRHPAGTAKPVPAVLLIAGSGPTDRNGNSPLISGSVNTLKTLADWLSADGVASLRYDKLGSGQTGVGPYKNRIAGIGIGPFEQESAAALEFLARQPGVDRSRLGVIGHSEGALFALLLATGEAGKVPPVHALGLLEPLSARYLDIIATQVDTQIAAAQTAGQLTAAQASSLRKTLTAAIAQLRTKGTVPAALPDGLSSVLSPSTALFLSQADKYDPAQLAARLPSGFPVLVSCSNADIQVSCGEVDRLVSGLGHAGASTDFVQLNGADHVLKQDASRTGADYGKPLPLSPQLERALRTFVQQHL
jgi:pimeloyl-ACP methyl ester carboxylesterase